MIGPFNSSETERWPSLRRSIPPSLLPSITFKQSRNENENENDIIMAETLSLRGELKGHRGWVTAIAPPLDPTSDVLLSSSRCVL
jgi:hypothetical protein